jgi:ATP-dependent exoDNAse (exonuclease V) beta subunit
MHSENHKDGSIAKDAFTGRDVLYREGAVGLLDVQRAADALLRQGRKPSVAAIREQLGGGSPNTITPLLAKYWEKLGSRLGEGPESLESVPEALARVAELLWRRALEEARERLKINQGSGKAATGVEELQQHVGKLSVALAEARAREGEQLTHLATLSKEGEELRLERAKLLALPKSTQELLEQQSARVAVLERARTRRHSALAGTASRSQGTGRKARNGRSTKLSARSIAGGRKRARTPRP